MFLNILQRNGKKNSFLKITLIKKKKTMMTARVRILCFSVGLKQTFVLSTKTFDMTVLPTLIYFKLKTKCL